MNHHRAFDIKPIKLYDEKAEGHFTREVFTGILEEILSEIEKNIGSKEIIEIHANNGNRDYVLVRTGVTLRYLLYGTNYVQIVAKPLAEEYRENCGLVKKLIDRELEKRRVKHPIGVPASS